jgi:hypothetical protein
MAVTIDKYSGSTNAVYDNVKETFPISVAPDTSQDGEVLTVDTIVAGTSYVTETIPTEPLTNGSGTGMLITWTAVAGGVTAITIVDGGIGYAVNDTQTIDDGDVNATFDVATVTANKVAVSGTDVVGSYSKFTEDFQVGDFIWIKDNDDLRRISNIVSDTKMTLQHPGTTETSSAYGVVKKEHYRYIKAQVDAVGAASINEVAKLANSSFEIENGKRFTPLLIDSTANANKVNITASM